MQQLQFIAKGKKPNKINAGTPKNLPFPIFGPAITISLYIFFILLKEYQITNKAE
jgi:hypothetical protein